MFGSICKEAGGGGANVHSDCLCSTFGPLKINKNVKVSGFLCPRINLVIG